MAIQNRCISRNVFAASGATALLCFTIGFRQMAFAFPRGKGEDPFVFDQSSSVVARGETKLLRCDGKTLSPDGGDPSRQGP